MGVAGLLQSSFSGWRGTTPLIQADADERRRTQIPDKKEKKISVYLRKSASQKWD